MLRVGNFPLSKLANLLEAVEMNKHFKKLIGDVKDSEESAMTDQYRKRLEELLEQNYNLTTCFLYISDLESKTDYITRRNNFFQNQSRFKTVKLAVSEPINVGEKRALKEPETTPAKKLFKKDE